MTSVLRPAQCLSASRHRWTARGAKEKKVGAKDFRVLKSTGRCKRLLWQTEGVTHARDLTDLETLQESGISNVFQDCMGKLSWSEC